MSVRPPDPERFIAVQRLENRQRRSTGQRDLRDRELAGRQVDPSPEVSSRISRVIPRKHRRLTVPFRAALNLYFVHIIGEAEGGSVSISSYTGSCC